MLLIVIVSSTQTQWYYTGKGYDIKRVIFVSPKCTQPYVLRCLSNSILVQQVTGSVPESSNHRQL